MVRYTALILLAGILFIGCTKNTVSKIPQISLITFMPLDTMTVNIDTVYLYFNLTDGDGDIGNDTTSGIFYEDSRFVSGGFQRADFPAIYPTAEDPNKGLQGTVLFYPIPQPVPRSDSLHMAVGDTMSYEFYVTDRAGHASNHIITHKLIIYPH